MIQIVSSRAGFAGALALFLERDFEPVQVITPDRINSVDPAAEVLVVDCVQNAGAFAAVRRAAFREAAPFVVALVSRPSDFVAEEARQAGARAVISDADGLETWSQVLGQIHEHRFQLGPSFRSCGTHLLQLLTRRQAEVLRCVLRGLTDAEVAHELGIAVSTAESHRRDLMVKMGVSRHDRLPLVGVQLGIVDPAELPPPSPLRQASRLRGASV